MLKLTTTYLSHATTNTCIIPAMQCSETIFYSWSLLVSIQDSRTSHTNISDLEQGINMSTVMSMHTQTLREKLILISDNSVELGWHTWNPKGWPGGLGLGIGGVLPSKILGSKTSYVLSISELDTSIWGSAPALIGASTRGRWVWSLGLVSPWAGYQVIKKGGIHGQDLNPHLGI